jgi:AAA domain-containing protein/FaeA-like protein
MTGAAFDRVLHALDQAGKRYKPDRDNHVQASCPGPSHKQGNRRQSLSITAIEGQVVMYCHVGCTTEDVLAALGLSMRDLFNDPRGATYAYDDGLRVHRSPDKKFRQSGNTSGDANGLRQLYRLSKIEQTPQASRPIYFPEGEKDVHAIEALGEIATTTPMGAKNVHKCDLAPLRGHHVIVTVDKDEPGETRARFLRQMLAHAADVEFKQAKIGKDVSDHIAADLSLDQLEPFEFPISRLLAGGRTGDWLDQQVFEPLQWVVPDVIPEGYSLLVGAPKIGKSWLALSIALAVASGGYMFGKIYCGVARPVLLLALEDSDRRMQSRARKLQPGDPIPRLLTYFTRVSPADVIPTMEAWLIEIPRHERPVVILDTIGKVIPPAIAGENQYQRDYRFSSQLQSITQQRPGMALMGLHHDRKANTDDFVESISGTNGIAGAADTLLVIARPRNEPQGLLKITGRDVEENEYGVKLTEGSWSLMGDNLKEAAKSARTVHATVGLGDRSAEIVEYVADHPEGVRAADVGEALGIDDDQAGVYLRRLHEAGRIRKRSRGLFAPRGAFEVFGVSETDQTLQTEQTGGIEEDQLPIEQTCTVCGEYMTVIEPGQTTHPTCEPRKWSDLTDEESAAVRSAFGHLAEVISLSRFKSASIDEINAAEAERDRKVKRS